MNKKTLLLILLSTLILPITASAQTLGSMAAAIASVAVTVGGYIVIVMWVVTGVLFLTAAGDPGKLGAAKTGLFAAIAGTILIILANGAVSFVRNSFGM